jgi:putative ABC transport system ATP-binding protein
MNISELARSVPLIELRGVHKNYQMGEESIKALKGIDLRIQAGEFVAVWGPSGSGKSTLCNLIGLLDTPSAGAVYLKGQDVTKLRDNLRSEVRNSALGFIFQSFNLIPVLSALENVMLPLQIAGVSAKAAKQQALERLGEMGLERYKTHRPAKLSGGQQQRVAIARALVSNPALVIADEPTANLDSENAVKIIELMRRINIKSGTTFIFSTHDQRLLERVGRQILMRDGEIAEDNLFEKPEAFRVAGVCR